MSAQATRIITNRVQRFMNIAIKVASKSPMWFKHGSVLVKGGKIIGFGHNYERKCFRGKEITSMHSEIQCLLNKKVQATQGTPY